MRKRRVEGKLKSEMESLQPRVKNESFVCLKCPDDTGQSKTNPASRKNRMVARGKEGVEGYQMK